MYTYNWAVPVNARKYKRNLDRLFKAEHQDIQDEHFKKWGETFEKKFSLEYQET